MHASGHKWPRCSALDGPGRRLGEDEFALSDPDVLEMIEMSPYSPEEYAENCGAEALQESLGPTSVLDGVLYETGTSDVWEFRGGSMSAPRRLSILFAAYVRGPALVLPALAGLGGCGPAVGPGDVADSGTTADAGSGESESSTGVQESSEVVMGHYTLTYFDHGQEELVNLGLVVLAQDGSGRLWPKDGCEDETQFPLSWEVDSDRMLVVEATGENAPLRSLWVALSGCMDGEAVAELVGQPATEVSLTRTEGCLSDCRLVACTDDPRVEACGL